MAYPATQAAPASPSAPAPAAPLDIAALMKRYLPAAPNDAAMRAQASSWANSDVAASLAAIHAEQQQALEQASQRAQQINAAALASSGYLDHLGFGERLRAAFQQAGQDQAATAQGFSGDLRQIAGGEADRVNANLAALGAPGTAPNADQTANVVYGLGAIPANVLTASAPLALARTQALPAQLLGAGQAEAVGALGAGQAAAARYNPQITAAIGGLPKLERSYLTQLQTSAAKARQDAIGNFFKAVSAQQAGDNAAALAHWRQAQIDATKHRDDLTAYYKGVAATQAGQRLDLTASRDATLETQGAARLKETSTHNAALEKTAAANATTSRLSATKPSIIGTDATGRFKYDPTAGTVTPLPGRLGKPAGGKKGGLTRKQRLTYQGTAVSLADSAFNGVKDANGNWLVDKKTGVELKPLSYQEAILEGQKEGIPMDVLLEALNRFYVPGASGRPQTKATATTQAFFNSLEPSWAQIG